MVPVALPRKVQGAALFSIRRGGYWGGRQRGLGWAGQGASRPGRRHVAAVAVAVAFWEFGPSGPVASWEGWDFRQFYAKHLNERTFLPLDFPRKTGATKVRSTYLSRHARVIMISDRCVWDRVSLVHDVSWRSKPRKATCAAYLATCTTGELRSPR